MSLYEESHELHLDDRLAEYTDEVLVGDVMSPPDLYDELLYLKKTLLRLKSAYPPIEVGEAQIKQMYVRLKNRTKKEDLKAKLPYWRQWLGSLQTRPQFGLTAAVVTILLAFLFLSPVLSSAGSSTTAFAINPAQGTWTMCAGSAVLIILFLWVVRRK